MAFIVEDGTGLSNATTYCTVAEADAYFDGLGTAWLATGEGTSDKQLALNQASTALDLLYGQQYKGYPLTADQALLFPRTTFTINGTQDVRGIPVHLKRAVFETALKYTVGENIFPDLNEAAVVKSKSIGIGDLTKTVDYAETGTREQLLGFYKIELLLKPLLTGEAGEDGYYPPYLGR